MDRSPQALSSILERLAVDRTPESAFVRVASPLSARQSARVSTGSSAGLPSLGISPESQYSPTPKRTRGEPAAVVDVSALSADSTGARHHYEAGSDEAAFLEQVAKELQVLNGQNEALTAENEGLRGELSRLRAELSKVAAHQSILVKAMSDVTEEMHAEREKREKLTNELLSSRQELSNKDQAYRDIVQENESLKKEIEALQQSRTQQEHALTERIFEIEEARCAAEQQFEASSRRCTEMSEQCAAFTKSIADLKRIVETKETKIDEKEQEIKKLSSRCDKLSATVSSMEKESEASRAKLLSIESTNAALNDEQRKKLKRLSSLEENLHEVQRQLQSSREEISRLESRNASIEDEIRKIATACKNQAPSGAEDTADVTSYDISSNAREQLKFVWNVTQQWRFKAKKASSKIKELTSLSEGSSSTSKQLEQQVHEQSMCVNKLTQEVERLQLSLASAKSELASATSKAARIEAELDTSSSTLESFRSKCQTLEERLSAEKFRREEVECQIHSLEDGIASLKKHLEAQQAQNTQLRSALDTKTASCISLTKDTAALIKQREEDQRLFKEQLTEVQAGRLKAQKKASLLQDEIKRLSEEVSSRNNDISSLLARLHALEGTSTRTRSMSQRPSSQGSKPSSDGGAQSFIRSIERFASTVGMSHELNKVDHVDDFFATVSRRIFDSEKQLSEARLSVERQCIQFLSDEVRALRFSSALRDDGVERNRHAGTMPEEATPQPRQAIELFRKATPPSTGGSDKPRQALSTVFVSPRPRSMSRGKTSSPR